MAKKLSQFDVEKDDWYYQKKLYINTRSSDSLYDELKEFRLELSKAFPDDDVDISKLMETAPEDEDYYRLRPRKEAQPKNGKNKSASSLLPLSEAAGFLDLKLSLLREQIELLKANLRNRKALHEKSQVEVYYELKRVKTDLQDLYGWRKGDKATVEMTRLELLRQLTALYREKRMNSLSHWKDVTFELRDLRQLVSEYKSLKSLTDMAGEAKGDGDALTA